MRVALLVVALACAVTTAYADDKQASLPEAMRLEAALDYEGALAIVEQAIAAGGATREQLVYLHLFAGKLAAGLDRTQEAERHFARVLALAPDTSFAEGTSPKITEPFETARARAAPLRVRAAVERTSVTLITDADRLGLVVGIAVTIVDKNGSTRELSEPRGLRIALPDYTQARELRVRALDEHSNTLWSQTSTQVPPRTTAEPTSASPAWYRRWSVWASASVGCLAIGGVSAWRFDVAQQEWDRRKTDGAELSTLQVIEQRGRRWSYAANAGFAAAAATGLIAIVAAAAGAPSSRGIVTATPDAVGLAVTGDF